MANPQPSDLEARDPAARDPGEAARRAAGGPPPGPVADPGFGRSAQPTAAEREARAREQGRRIATGQVRQGRIALTTPRRRAVFLGGMIAAAVFAVLLSILA